MEMQFPCLANVCMTEHRRLTFEEMGKSKLWYNLVHKNDLMDALSLFQYSVCQISGTPITLENIKTFDRHHTTERCDLRMNGEIFFTQKKLCEDDFLFEGC